LTYEETLPVELVSFTHEIKDDQIILKWSTATELNNYGFEIQRSVDGSEFRKIAFVTGNGNSSSPKNYNYNDKDVSGFLSYRLKQLDNNGGFTYSPVVKVDAVTINDFSVFQNYPNPFNPSTSIKFKVPVESRIKVTIINSLGEEVASLFEGNKNSGIHEVVWDGSNSASGIYFAHLIITPSDGKAGIIKTIKMILNK